MAYNILKRFEKQTEINPEGMNALIDEIGKITGALTPTDRGIPASLDQVSGGTGLTPEDITVLRDNAGSVVSGSSVRLTDDGTINVDKLASDTIALSVDQTTIDHGTIGGLTDDDHTQYILVDASRAFNNGATNDCAVVIEGGANAVLALDADYDSGGSANVASTVVFRDKGSQIGYISTANDIFGNVIIIDANQGAVAGKVVLAYSGGDTEITGKTVTKEGMINNITRITSIKSPYTMLVTDHVLFVDTDGGAITVNLLAGVEGTNLKIINCGSSGNDLTVDPNGTEQLYGSGAGVASTLSDGEVINIHFNEIEGWW